MKKHHFNFLSFLFVVGLMVAAVLATYIATTGTGGFMTRAGEGVKCVDFNSNRAVCKLYGKCYWTGKDPYRGKCSNRVGFLGSCAVTGQCTKGLSCLSGKCRVFNPLANSIPDQNTTVPAANVPATNVPATSNDGGTTTTDWCASVKTCANGTSCDGTPVTGTAGQTVCGLNNKRYQCGTNGAWKAGSKAPCSCSTCAGGILSDGTPVTGTSGQVVCGLNNVQYVCGADGAWEWRAPSCSCPATQ